MDISDISDAIVVTSDAKFTSDAKMGRVRASGLIERA
jgi:hypothetical protein